MPSALGRGSPVTRLSDGTTAGRLGTNQCRPAQSARRIGSCSGVVGVRVIGLRTGGRQQRGQGRGVELEERTNLATERGVSPQRANITRY